MTLRGCEDELLDPVVDSKAFSEDNFSGWIRKMKI
jgi:hypothetical protein